MPLVSEPEDKLILMKVGADPEALIWSRRENQIIPAHQFCGGHSSLSTWIGTDGHSVTAEFRPSPNKNVLMVVADLALAMGVVEKTLADINERSNLGLELVAQPLFREEPLGGHVHVSYWYPPSLRTGGEHDFNCVYTYLCSFINPLMERLGMTTRGHFNFREQSTPRGKFPPNRLFHPAHLEFRKPGTWLANPSLAYAFLGLTKLAILNYPFRFTEDNYVNTLRGLKTSRDLATLADTVDYLWSRPDWLNQSPQVVDFKAWKEVLEPAG